MSLLRSIRNAALVAQLTALVLAMVNSDASAQTFGLELGLAGIENYDPFTPGVGATVTAPLTARLSVSASYARWVGHDGNEEFVVGSSDLRFGYGNQAFLISGLVRLAGSTGTTFSVGAGAGWFQHYQIVGGRTESLYDAIPVGTLLVRFGGDRRIVPYVRTDVHIPSDPRLQYGLLRIGADITLRK